jgi:hypothetical protein
VPTDIDRFLALVRRELGAEDAHVLVPEAPSSPDDERQVACRLPDGRGVIALFAEVPPDREAKQRRLEMLASTFDSVVEEAPPPGTRRSRPPVAISLHEELVALCTRAAAVNAIVIDANSPVVWGAADPQGVVAQPPLASSPRMAEDPANAAQGEGTPSALSRKAVHNVRGWPELAALRKGKHVRKMDRDQAAPLAAHSFASIYLLVVVFSGAFDELRAERAILEALPRIERLVLALPPFDPQPFEGGGAMRMRKPRRR